MITMNTTQATFLDNEDRQRKVYSELVRRHGDSYKSLHWHSRQTQQLRFETFLQIGELDGCSVLDIGCGIGDFAVYLEACGIDVDFTGYDIVPEAIKLAQLKCPTAIFEARNILLAPPTRRFDYIVSSGIFAFGDQQFFEGIVERAVSLAQVAYGFNLYRTRQSSFFSPTVEYVLDFCNGLEINRTEVVHDYLHDDYTFFAYR